MSTGTQRGNATLGDVGYGFTMRPQDPVLTTVAGIDVDSSGNLIAYDVVGNNKGRLGAVFSASVAAGATVTGNTEAVSASVTLPANILRSGTGVRVRGTIIAPTTLSTDTLQARLRLGSTTLTGTAIFTNTAVDVADGSFCVFDMLLVAQGAPSAATSIISSGQVSNFGTTSTGTSPTARRSTPTNFATNAPLLLEVTLQWSTASANAANVEYLFVEVL